MQVLFSGAATLGAEGRKLSPLPSSMGARSALHTELFLRWPLHLPILLYYFSKRQLQVHVNFHISCLVKGHSPMLWANPPQTPSIAYYCYENNISSIFFPEEKFNTKIYPCGGTYMYIDMPSVEAFPRSLVTHRRPWSFSKLLPPPTLMVLRSFWWQWW